MRDIKFTDNGWSDFQYWSKTNRKLFIRISKLIEETARDPFDGIGKPEALKHNLNKYWSRRIDSEHRLVYAANRTEIIIISCRFHYQ